MLATYMVTICLPIEANSFYQALISLARGRDSASVSSTAKWTFAGFLLLFIAGVPMTIAEQRARRLMKESPDEASPRDEV